MTSTIPVVLERENVNDEAVTLVRWIAHHGDKVEANALLAEVETSKANVEVYAPAAGYLHTHFKQGEDVPVTAPIAHISSEAPAEFGQVPVPVVQSAPGASAGSEARSFGEPVAVSKNGGGAHEGSPGSSFGYRLSAEEFVAQTNYRQRFSPVAMKMMEANGLTAERFQGISVVRKQDVLDLLQPPPPPSPAVTAAPAKTTIPLPKQPYREVALSKGKRREGANLAAGTSNAVQSSVSVTCVTRGLRRAIERKSEGGSASALMVYEVSRLLRKYPVFNSTFRDGVCLEYEQVNVGYAMDDGRGLKVPAITACDTLPLLEIATQLRALTEAYLEDKLTPAQMSSGTFSISDLSGMGVSSFVPLISENQGAILGVGGEQFLPGSAYGTYTLVLTFDHQLADGRTAALFLNTLKERLSHYEDAATAEQAAAPVEPACSRCFRTVAELRAVNQHLLRSAVGDQSLCSLCVGGY